MIGKRYGVVEGWKDCVLSYDREIMRLGSTGCDCRSVVGS